MQRFTVAVVSAALLAVLAAPSSAAAAFPTAVPDGAASGTFGAVADTYVVASSPAAAFGTRPFLRADASPETTSLLRFDVQGVSDLSSASLRVHVEAGSPAGVEVHAVSDTVWDETTTTYANAPDVGPVLDASGPTVGDSWVLLDVSSSITGNGPVSLALTTPGSTAIRLTSREGANPPQLLVPSPPPVSDFAVASLGAGYQATSTASTYTGSLKSVVESAAHELDAAGGGTISFDAGTFDLGGESLQLRGAQGISFEGRGIDATVIQNSSDAPADSEVFALADVAGIAIRDLTVVAAGAPRSTSDAVQFDAASDSILERVRVASSRSRGVVVNGMAADSGAGRNTVRDCVVDGVPGDGIELLAAGDNVVEGCEVTDVGGHGIQVTKASPSAGRPNQKANGNVVRGNTIDNAGGDGVNVVSSDRTTILGNTITNSADVTANRDGIRILSTDSVTCDDTVVQDNVATDDQAVKTQSYGASITSELCHRTVLTGNAFLGNRVGEVRDLGTDTRFDAGDTEPPSVPGQLVPRVRGPFEVDLSWDSATDDSQMAGYTVYRDGQVIATTGPSTYFYNDTTVDQDTTYSYAVDAFDMAGNHSDRSTAVTVTTAALGATFSVVPDADAYVNAAKPDANYGSATSLRVDGSPDVRSYLRFTVRGSPTPWR